MRTVDPLIRARMTRYQWVLHQLNEIGREYESTSRWRRRKRKRLMRERILVKALNFDVLYGADPDVRRCTRPPDGHATCNGWPCEDMAQRLLAAGRTVPNPWPRG